MENRICTDDVIVSECLVFHSFLRLRCLLPTDSGWPSSAELARVDEGIGGVHPPSQSVTIKRDPDNGRCSIEVQALVDRDAFPVRYALVLVVGGERITLPAEDLVARETADYARSSLSAFKTMVEEQARSADGRRPKLLDVGGRARSGTFHGREFSDCDVTVLDIRSDTGVDVVGDVHAMSRVIARESFDLILCVSVFEHLMMPWKAVLEMNHVLRPGGLALIQTHQTVGMHDVPWDYYRFSDACWPGLFNAATGFTIRNTMMNQFVHVVAQHYYASAQCPEGAGGFLESSVIVQKTGPTDLTWPVDLTEVVRTQYPG